MSMSSKKIEILACFLLILIGIESFLIYLLIQKIEKKENEEEIYFDLIAIYKPKEKESLQWYYRYKINEIYNPTKFNFYYNITQNREVADTIIRYAIEYDIPLHLAFSIAYVESRFIPTALSPTNGNGTRDWGLFQLNDGHRNWTRAQYFNIEKNTREGLSYFRFCLDNTSSYVEAIGAYNRGLRGVQINGVPQRYVEMVLEYESFLDEKFNAYIE